MQPRVFSCLLLVVAFALPARAAVEACCNGRDDDRDAKVDTEDSDCGDSPCVCTRPEPELFFGEPGPWQPEDRPRDGELRFEDRSSSTLSIRLRSLLPAYTLAFRIVRSSRGTEHVYEIDGPEHGSSPVLTILLDFTPGIPVRGSVANELVTPRRIVSVEPGPAFDDGYPDASLLDIVAEDPAGDVVSVVFHGTWERPQSMIYLDGARECEGVDLLRLELEPAAPAFRRGDANADGRSDIADAVAILGYLFLHGDRPSCDTAADVDVSGSLAITDAVRILLALFAGGPPIQPPFPDCGPRLQEDSLGCGSFDC